MDATVSIKGVRDGLAIALGDGPLDVLLEDLAHQLATRERFFQGGRVAVNAGERELGPAELQKISDLLASHGIVLWAVLSEHAGTQEAARKLELGTRLPGSGVELTGGDRRLEPSRSAPSKQSEAENGSDCMLVRGALRSGRLVQSPGHVVVIGDVNPGAEIVAGGDVVVWGRIRGLVHAGAFGDRNALVCALDLAPTQLRIAELITVSPAGSGDLEPVPEQASIKDGRIVAESWSPGYRGRR
jgi:septum site-determining protein MinC